MKSLIRVLVVFWISQSVFCNIVPKSSVLKSSALFNSNEVVQAYSKVIQNCDMKNFTLIVQSLMPLKHSYVAPLDIYIEEYSIICEDEETKQKLFDEISSFFKSCIDPKYIQAVDNLHAAVLKLDKLICTSEEQFMEIANITSDKSELVCFAENTLQVASCIFSEKEITRLSKNVSQVMDFTAMLIGGNDNECGVVNRIEKCVLKNMRSCGGLLKVIGFTVKTMLEIFDCKIIETTDLSQETNAVPLTPKYFTTLADKAKDATMQCDLKVYMEKLEHSFSKLDLQTTSNGNDKYVAIMKSVCSVPEQLNFLETIDEMGEVLKKCADTKYVEHIDKVVKSLERSINSSCSTMDQHEILISDFESKDENMACIINKVFPILGCVFSSEQVREVIADSSKFINFTMSLLEGEDRECGTFDEIQNCIIESMDSCPQTSNLMKFKFNLMMNTMQCKIDNFQNVSMIEYMNIVPTTTEESKIYMDEVSTTTTEQSLIMTVNHIIKEFTFTNFNEVLYSYYLLVYFYFMSYISQAFEFMTRVAFYAAEIKYYPTFFNEDNKVTITVKSEDSVKHHQMADFIDQISKLKQ